MYALFVRRIAATIGTIGFLLFALAFMASMVSPGYVERVAKDLIRLQVEKRFTKKLMHLMPSFLRPKQAIYSKNRAQLLRRPNANCANNCLSS